MIDFDVATFFSPDTLHRRYVGTEVRTDCLIQRARLLRLVDLLVPCCCCQGYMAPEVVEFERRRKNKDKDFMHEGWRMLGRGYRADLCG